MRRRKLDNYLLRRYMRWAMAQEDRSSLDAVIEDARKFGASVDTARRVHNLVTANTTSDIQRFEVKFAPNSTDRLALWVDLFVNQDLSPSQAKVDTLNKVAKTIRLKLLNENLDYWPYVTIRSSV